MTTSAWYLGQIQALLARGYYGDIILRVQGGAIERMFKHESVVAPAEVRNGNSKNEETK